MFRPANNIESNSGAFVVMGNRIKELNLSA